MISLCFAFYVLLHWILRAIDCKQYSSYYSFMIKSKSVKRQVFRDFLVHHFCFHQITSEAHSENPVKHHCYIGMKIYTFFYFSGTFPASEYLFSAPRRLLILVVLPHFRISFEHSSRNLPRFFDDALLTVLLPPPSTWAASSNFYDLRLSRVLAQRV